MAEQTNPDQPQTIVPDPQAGLIESFNQFALSNRWEPNSEKYKTERRAYMHAEAETHIGSIERGGAAERLAGLQKLCEELGVNPIPGSITRCKKELKKVHVCIVNLIDHQHLGVPIQIFDSQRDLQQHVKTSKHYFPKDEAKQKDGGLLKVLLREIINGRKARG